MKVAEAAGRIGISKQAIHKRIRASGIPQRELISPSGDLTEAGIAFLNEVYPGKLEETDRVNLSKPVNLQSKPEETSVNPQSKLEETSVNQSKPEGVNSSKPEETSVNPESKPLEAENDPESSQQSIETQLAVAQERIRGLEEQLAAAKEEIANLREALQREQQVAAISAGLIVQALPERVERPTLWQRLTGWARRQ